MSFGESEKHVTEQEIKKASEVFRSGYFDSPGEARVLLVDLIVKSAAGYRSSYTEEAFLARCGVLKRDGTPNKKGRLFLCAMLYKHSNFQSDYVVLQNEFKRLPRSSVKGAVIYD
ncbi:MAG: hypothetical protein CMB99_16325 [Flavobacteriaceae bacterium]|nr:hypothetical protein [Flavobacteriaceae bacterium]|tara:strand:- start:2959 stop:3303 length:345 start_codon:yes stop_codon:yes gene_type:complete